jgi:hypothetical protein
LSASATVNQYSGGHPPDSTNTNEAAFRLVRRT